MSNNQNGQKSNTSESLAAARSGKRVVLPVPLTYSSHPRFQAAADIVRRLREANFEAYFVGGCVRDLVLALPNAPAPQSLSENPENRGEADCRVREEGTQGRSSTKSFEGSRIGSKKIDIDIASSADPADIRRLFRHSHFVGQVFGVSMVDMGDTSYEVATFRAEGTYSDGRRPDSVTKGELHTDACRRDFTVNALYFDPLTSEIVDFHEGLPDAQNRILRTVGDPHRRFSEDRLRVVRMCRFAALLGFQIQPETWIAARAAAPFVTTLSRERILMEIKKTPGAVVARFLSLLKELRMDELLWGLAFDPVPVWQDSPESRNGLESLVEHDSHFPVTFVLLASWKNFLERDLGTQRQVIAEFQSWPTTVQDRKLLAALFHFVQLLTEPPQSDTSVLETPEAETLIPWALALLGVCQKLSPLAEPEILALAQAVLDSHKTKAPSAPPVNEALTHIALRIVTAALKVTEDTAAEQIKTLVDIKDVDLSKKGVVTLVNEQGRPQRTITFLHGLVRLTAACHKILGDSDQSTWTRDFVEMLRSFCQNSEAEESQNETVVAHYFALLGRERSPSA